jgi:hypothetical protein
VALGVLSDIGFRSEIMKKSMLMLLLIPVLFGCKTAIGPSSTRGDAFHGGNSRIFSEQQGNVLMIWKASRNQELKGKK